MAPCRTSWVTVAPLAARKVDPVVRCDFHCGVGGVSDGVPSIETYMHLVFDRSLPSVWNTMRQ